MAAGRGGTVPAGCAPHRRPEPDRSGTWPSSPVCTTGLSIAATPWINGPISMASRSPSSNRASRSSMRSSRASTAASGTNARPGIGFSISRLPRPPSSGGGSTTMPSGLSANWEAESQRSAWNACGMRKGAALLIDRRPSSALEQPLGSRHADRQTHLPRQSGNSSRTRIRNSRRLGRCRAEPKDGRLGCGSRRGPVYQICSVSKRTSRSRLDERLRSLERRR